MKSLAVGEAWMSAGGSTTERFKAGIAHTSLPESVYRELRRAILNGELKPGQILRQEELARDLGVSRAPLREALPRLEAEGFVVLHPRRGYSIVSLDPVEITEIFELRMLIEARAAFLAAEQRNAADIARARALLDEMTTIAPENAAAIVRWSDLNFQFHDVLLAPAGRPHLQRIVRGLRAQVEPYVRVEVGITRGLGEAQGEHERLFEAFAAGDAKTSERLTREHCEHTARRLVEGLPLRGGPAS